MLPDHPNLDKDYYRESELSYLTDAIDACVFAEMEHKKLRWVRSQRAEIELVHGDVRSLRINLFFTKSISKIASFMLQTEEKLRAHTEKKITAQLRCRKSPADYLRRLTINQIERGRKYRELALREQIKNEEFNRGREMPKNRFKRFMLALFGPRSRYPRETGSLVMGGSIVGAAGAMAYLHHKHVKDNFMTGDIFPFGHSGKGHSGLLSGGESVTREQIFASNPTHTLGGSLSSGGALSKLEPASGVAPATLSQSNDDAYKTDSRYTLAENYANSMTRETPSFEETSGFINNPIISTTNNSQPNILGAEAIPAFIKEENDSTEGSNNSGSSSTGGTNGEASGDATAAGSASGSSSSSNSGSNSGSTSGNIASSGSASGSNGSNSGTSGANSSGGATGGGGGNANSGSNSTNAVVAGTSANGAPKLGEGLLPLSSVPNPIQGSAQIASNQNQKLEMLSVINSANQAVITGQITTNASNISGQVAVMANGAANPANVLAVNNNIAASAANGVAVQAAVHSGTAAVATTANAALNNPAAPRNEAVTPAIAESKPQVTTTQGRAEVAENKSQASAAVKTEAAAPLAQESKQEVRAERNQIVAAAPKAEAITPAQEANTHTTTAPDKNPNLAQSVVSAVKEAPATQTAAVEAKGHNSATDTAQSSNVVKVEFGKTATEAPKAPAAEVAIQPKVAEAPAVQPAATATPAAAAKPAAEPAAPLPKVAYTEGKVNAKPEIPDSLKGLKPDTLGQVAATKISMQDSGVEIKPGTSVYAPSTIDPNIISHGGPQASV